MQTDLSEFCGLLNAQGVEYLVVGGHAVAFHGHPRFTGDVDFFVNPTLENARRVLSVLADFGFGDSGVGEEELAVSDRILQLGRPPNRIDIMTSITGVEFGDAWASRVSGVLAGQPAHFIGRDALVRNKLASGRDKDQVDVRTLQSLWAVGDGST